MEKDTWLPNMTDCASVTTMINDNLSVQFFVDESLHFLCINSPRGLHNSSLHKCRDGVIISAVTLTDSNRGVRQFGGLSLNKSNFTAPRGTSLTKEITAIKEGLCQRGKKK